SAFRPLIALRDAIRARQPDDLTPVPINRVAAEVMPLIDAVNHHTTRLTDMLAARKRFLADAAHQIRTPLAVLGTQAEYGLRQDDPAEMRRTLQGLVKSIGNAQRLANQMLALSRAEAVNGLIQEKAPVDVAALAHEAASELGLLAVKKGIDLAYVAPKSPAMVDGNGPMLQEMIANLIDNAIRYTPAGGHVELAVASAADAVVITVADDGPGIPAGERELVFHRFYRILGQGDTHGSGLGLAIVREICLAHGGRIELGDGRARDGGHGLQAKITLPVATA
ncbi:MAG TPA: ATP-binding protein, partial [Rhodocyclaceae bacterium]|nr:ATP-binding protein [Rhodocyclaceae bacterium]